MAKIRKFKQNPGNTAITYNRFSSSAQRECSIEQQREAARQLADKEGLIIVKEYSDYAISGTRDDRPQYQLMLYEVEKIRPAYLIIWKTDRLSRDKYELNKAKKRLRDCGVKILYVAESFPEDEGSQVLMESFYEGVAASEIVKHSKNVMRGLRYNAERALYNGRQILGYQGKVNNQYEIDPNTDEIVRKIFNDFISGTSLTGIRNELNSKGITTNKGNQFTVNSLRHILKNRAYIGEYKWGDVIIPDGMPKIIDQNTFDQVQKRFEDNNRGGKGAVRKLNPNSNIADYWLTGKLFCKECGSPMTGLSGTSKSGESFYYYSCSAHRKKKCSLKNKSKKLLEKIAREVLHNLINNPVNRLMIAEEVFKYYQSQNDNGLYIESLKAQERDVSNRLKNILKAIEQGILNDTTAKRMDELEQQQKNLKEEINAEEYRQNFCLTYDQVVRYINSFVGDLNKVEHIKETLKYFVKNIYVSETKVIFTFHYSDDTREIEIDEMKSYIDNLDKIYEILNITDETNIIRNKTKKSIFNEYDRQSDPYQFSLECSHTDCVTPP